jgi:hypothetical protein
LDHRLGLLVGRAAHAYGSGYNVAGFSASDRFRRFGGTALFLSFAFLRASSSLSFLGLWPFQCFQPLA